MAGTNPPTDVTNALEADSFENDSAYGDHVSEMSDRTSLYSDALKYRQENGRRYHGYRDGAYLAPNDEPEQSRLDLNHHIFNLVKKDKLYQAPIDKPACVLDVGTGTGIWAIDFGDLHPESHVIGIDLSPIQPQWVPPNVEFLVEDVEDEWVGKSYDYIHIRILSGALKSWSKLIERALNHLNPDGWLEIVEFEVVFQSNNNSCDRAPELKKWTDGLLEAGAKIGRQMDVAVNLEKWLQQAGFTNVVQHKTLVPLGPWPKDKELKIIGAYQLMNMLDATTSYGQAHFTRVLGWTPLEYEVFSAKVRNQLQDRSLQLCADLYTVYGQRAKTTP